MFSVSDIDIQSPINMATVASTSDTIVNMDQSVDVETATVVVVDTSRDLVSKYMKAVDMTPTDKQVSMWKHLEKAHNDCQNNNSYETDGIQLVGDGRCSMTNAISAYVAYLMVEGVNRKILWLNGSTRLDGMFQDKVVDFIRPHSVPTKIKLNYVQMNNGNELKFISSWDKQKGVTADVIIVNGLNPLPDRIIHELIVPLLSVKGVFLVVNKYGCAPNQNDVTWNALCPIKHTV